MPLADQKKRLRKQMLHLRDQLSRRDKKGRDRKICQSIWEMLEGRGYENVHCFLPFGTEINIYPLIKKMLNSKVTVVTPKTLPNRKLQHLTLKSLDEVEKGVFGTSHPANTKEYLGEYDLIIVPGLAFNDANHRLGYGGGYYDNFLTQHPLAFKLGICYAFQNVEYIPMEPHDVILDEIIFA